MRFRATLHLPIAAICFIAGGTLTTQAENRVELEVMVADGSPLAAHEWARSLRRVPFDSVRVMNQVGTVRPEIQMTGPSSAPYFRVTAVASGDTLVLPGGKRFRRGDDEQLRRWLEGLNSKTASRPSPSHLV